MGIDVEKVNFICLHGFLGQPTDWDLIKSYFMVSPFAQKFDWWSVDYMNQPGLDARNSFLEWSQNFNRQVAQKFPLGPRILVGYSLGGRLALHALAESAKLYDAVILLSTNPGLTREKEKVDRVQNDQIWAQKFLQSPWAELMTQWNGQNVFKDSLLEPKRLEIHYQRDLLAKALTEWSLANQADFRELIASQQEKILWLSGEKDIKFLSIAMEIQKKSPGIATETIAGAAHRVLFDNPSDVAQRMIPFLTKRFI